LHIFWQHWHEISSIIYNFTTISLIITYQHRHNYIRQHYAQKVIINNDIGYLTYNFTLLYHVFHYFQNSKKKSSRTWRNVLIVTYYSYNEIDSYKTIQCKPSNKKKTQTKHCHFVNIKETCLKIYFAQIWYQKILIIATQSLCKYEINMFWLHTKLICHV
jgi:hypothetical protein